MLAPVRRDDALAAAAALEAHRDADDQRGAIEPCLGVPSCRFPLTLLPEFADQARESLRPDPHLERVFLHVAPPDEQLDDPRPLRREQLLAGGRARRSGPGRSRHRPEAVIRDRSYSSYATRRDLRRRGIRPSILRGETSGGSTSWTGTLP